MCPDRGSRVRHRRLQVRVPPGLRVPLRGPRHLLRRNEAGRGVPQHGAGAEELVRHLQVPAGRRQCTVVFTSRHLGVQFPTDDAEASGAQIIHS